MNRFEKIFPFLLVLILAASINIDAQEDRIKFQRISLEQGLSQSTVLSILQDRQGFLWFGTLGGLNRYDGYHFEIYNHDPDNPDSISNDSVQTLFQDQTGLIWIGTRGGGLNIFNPESEQFTKYRFDPDNPGSLSSNDVNKIYEDSTGILWIGTSRGLNRFDRETKQFFHYKYDQADPNSLSNNNVRAIIEDSAGVLWIGTSDGLNQLDRNTGQFIHIRIEQDDPNSLSTNDIYTLFADTQESIWIGTTDKGVIRFDLKTRQFIHYLNDPKTADSLSDNRIDTIYEDSDGELWVGTWGGLDRFNRETKQFIHYRNNLSDPNSLSKSRVTSILEDQSGILWIGTAAGGLNKVVSHHRNFVHYQADPDNPNSLSGNAITAFYEDKNKNIWVGMWGSGLDILNRKTGEIINYKHDPDNPNSLSNNRITIIYEDSAGDIWIGTFGGGLNKFDLSNGSFSHFKHNPDDFNSLSSNNVYFIYEDKAGTLWVGTYGGGVNKFDDEKKRFTHYRHDPEDPTTLGGDRIYKIFEDSLGVFWIGNTETLDQFDRKTGQFIRFKNDPENPQTLRGNRIRTIYEDSAKRLWIGTTEGLNLFNRDNSTFVHYSIKEGLPDKVIYAILEDDQKNLWITTNKGLSKFNPDSGLFKNYTIEDGLQSNEFNIGAYYKSDSGEIFFGGGNGFNAFYPNRINDNPHIPSVVITSFKLFNKEVPILDQSILEKSIIKTDVLALSYKDKIFSFEFVALDYTTPEKNQYAYMMKGFDEEWNNVDSTQRIANYTNLSPGNYTFKVKASNNDGIWNEMGKSIAISITPPWWQTWWAYSLYVLAAVASVLGYIQWRVSSTESRRHDLEIQVVERTKELTESEARFRGLSESAFEGIIIHDQGQIFEINQSVIEIFGYSRVELIGQHIRILLTPGAWEAAAQRISEGSDEPYEIRGLRKEGLEFPIEMHGKQVPYQGRQLRVSALRDITLYKKVEESLKQAKTEAEAANQAKSAFLANMSHDLRTPMNAVMGFSEILFHKERDPQKKNYLKSIQTSGKALLSLINDVLDLSKIEAGKLELEYTAVSMQKLFSEMSTIFQYKISDKGLKFEVQADTNLPDSLLLDESRLRQVLMNLLSNAVKFTDEGSIRIYCHGVEIEEDIKSRVNLIIEVTDSGKGIPTEDQESIFNPFEQVSGQKTTQYGGSGLGLAITKNIINMMNGTISVNSKLGQGSTFHVELKDVEITAKMISGVEKSWDFDSDSIKFTPVKVLIADDIDYNREVLAGYLNPFNFELYFAENGKVVVEQAQKISPDLILMDMKMPVMDGYEASRLLKSKKGTQDVPIIAVTASALAQDEETIRQYCDDYLRKPISQYDLVKTLKKFLKYTEKKKKAPKENVDINMTIPTKTELEELHEVVLYGDMDRVIVHLDRLEQKNGKLKKFCDQFKSYAVGYKVDKILTLLKEYLSV